MKSAVRIWAAGSERPESRYEQQSSMSKGAVPERYRDILDSTGFGHLATIGPDGRPQVNPVWFRTQESLSQTDARASIDPPPRRPYNAVAGLSRASSLMLRLAQSG